MTDIKKEIYYAVKYGRTPGIYTDWKRAEKQIYMHKGSIVRKFDTLEDARTFMEVDQPFTKETVSCYGRRKGSDIVVAIFSTFESPQLYNLDPEEYKTSHAILEALNDYLGEFLTNHIYKPSSLEIVTSDVCVFNILQTYLEKWKQNLYMTTRGPVEHVDMMKALYQNLKKFPAYETTHNPYHDLLVDAKRMIHQPQ